MQRDRARSLARELQLHRPSMGVSFHGRSMEPFLVEADELTVEPVSWADLRAGDIVTCRLDDRFPTFRIVRKLRTKLVLRGDNWPFADFEAWPADVLGRVVERRRGDTRLRERDWEWRARTAVALADDRARRVKRWTERAGARLAGGVRRRVARWIARRDGPESIHVNVAASCNLACRMCPYLPVHDDPAYVREMSEETFRGLLPALASARVVHLSGSGEPFMNRHLLRFVDLARETNPSIEVDITTNGTLLTRAVVDQLMARRVTRLVVSIDGVTQDTVGAIRTGINVAKVFEHLALVARRKAEAASPWPRVRVNYMIGFGSYGELPEFVRRARPLGIDEIHLLEVFDGTAEAAERSLRHSLDADGGATLRLAKRLADASGIRLLPPVTAHHACHHPYVPHVAENGDVSPCCYLDYEGRTFFLDGRTVRMPKVTYGNVNDHGLLGAWRHPGYRHLRAHNGEENLPPTCRTCLAARVPTSIRVLEVLG